MHIVIPDAGSDRIITSTDPDDGRNPIRIRSGGALAKIKNLYLQVTESWQTAHQTVRSSRGKKIRLQDMNDIDENRTVLVQLPCMAKVWPRWPQNLKSAKLNLAIL
jgi:hypothetical protein